MTEQILNMYAVYEVGDRVMMPHTGIHGLVEVGHVSERRFAGLQTTYKVRSHSSGKFAIINGPNWANEEGNGGLATCTSFS
jgi:hypothetical protein